MRCTSRMRWTIDQTVTSRARFSSRSAFATLTLILALSILSACHPKGLPDSASPAAQTYVARCGQCHAPYNPNELTAAMWDTQVTMMEVKIQNAGLPPLSADDRETILDYLKHNAGSQ